MRLLNVHTGRIETYYGDKLKGIKYAILSHTWLSDVDGSPQEALYQDFVEQEHPPPGKDMDVEDPIFTDGHPRIEGFKKIQRCRQRVIDENIDKKIEEKIDYVWIDTCCIDKTSSAELSEAITSMFSWYSNAKKCYIFLEGIRTSEGDKMKDIGKSRWFQRGWTLQELIASKTRIFLDENWEEIGIMDLRPGADQNLAREIAETLYEITNIQEDVLMQDCDLSRCGVPQRMEWAAHRMTTRPEDMAYCLMGIFNVNMQVQYGEGFEEAFRRLQEEYIARYPDHSVFAWIEHEESPRSSHIGCLAKHPKDFVDTTSYGGEIRGDRPLHPFHVTHLGVSMKVPLRDHDGNQYAILNLFKEGDDEEDDKRYGIQLEETELSRQGTPIYRRVRNSRIQQFQPPYPEEYIQIFIEERLLEFYWVPTPHPRA